MRIEVRADSVVVDVSYARNRFSMSPLVSSVVSTAKRYSPFSLSRSRSLSSAHSISASTGFRQCWMKSILSCSVAPPSTILGSFQCGTNPVFKDYDILVNGVRYRPYEFLRHRP